MIKRVFFGGFQGFQEAGWEAVPQWTVHKGQRQHMLASRRASSDLPGWHAGRGYGSWQM
jgi:hypothetical protein